MLRPLFSMLSPAGPRARLSVLIFHRVLRQPDPLFPGEMHARRFDAVCRWLRGWFNVLPLDEAVLRLHSGDLPARSAAITFDDGYADNHDIALPILQRYGLNATFFVATGFLDGGRMWNDTVIEAVRGARGATLDLPSAGIPGIERIDLHDESSKTLAIERLLGAIKYFDVERRQASVDAIAGACGATLPDQLMLSSAQVRALRRSGMLVGAHTVTHPILAKMTTQAVRHEVMHCKETLEALLQERVSLFAYPNGKRGQDYNDATVQVIRDCGFAAALSTNWGVSDGKSDLFQLPRFTPWDRSMMRFGLRMAGNLRNAARARF